MIQSIQEQELVLTSNTAPITFADTDLRTASANCFNGWLNHNEGSATFNIVAGGIYEIDFTTNITSATAGALALGIFADGVKLNGGEADTVIATAGDYENISIHKYISKTSLFLRTPTCYRRSRTNQHARKKSRMPKTNQHSE